MNIRTCGKYANKFLLLLLVICLSFTLVSCNQDSEESEVRTQFVVGFDASFPPYGYRDDNGEYVGFDLDLAQEVCDRQGWELIKQPIEWDAKDMELSSGTIDCIWNGFTMSEDRLDDYTWSEPYVDNSQVFIVEKETGIKSFDDLAGKNVAVQTASSALEALNSDECKELTASFKSLEEIPDYNTAFMNLDAGSVDAIAMDIGVANYQIESRGDKYIILEQPIITEKYGIAFLKGNEELKDQVQNILYDMLNDGTLEKIADKWGLSDNLIFGQATDETTQTDNETTQVDLWSMIVQLASGMLETIKIFAITLVFTLPLGLIVSFGRMSRFKIIKYITQFYIAVMRGTPLMLQLLVVYFGPYYLFGISLSREYRFIAVIIGFVLNYAAYFAEIYRSGIESMPVGQYEAARILGYNRAQTFIRIIFPQVIKRVLPSITNEIITLVKDTSLAFSIAYVELFSLAKAIAAAQTTMIPFVVAGIFYFVFNFLVATVMNKVEKKLNYYEIK